MRAGDIIGIAVGCASSDKGCVILSFQNTFIDGIGFNPWIYIPCKDNHAAKQLCGEVRSALDRFSTLDVHGWLDGERGTIK